MKMRNRILVRVGGGVFGLLLSLGSTFGLLAQGTAEPLVWGEMRLMEDGRIDVSLFVAAVGTAPATLLNRIDGGEGRRILHKEALELVWVGLSEPGALELLREGRASDEAFRLRIVMSPGVAFDDIWDLQAALSQAGIRRVQIVTGSP